MYNISTLYLLYLQKQRARVRARAYTQNKHAHTSLNVFILLYIYNLSPNFIAIWYIYTGNMAHMMDVSL